MNKTHGTWLMILTCFTLQTTFCGGQTVAPLGTQTNLESHVTLQKWATCPPWNYTPLTQVKINEKASNMLAYVAAAKANIEDNVLNDFEPDFPLAKETIDHWMFHDVKLALCSANLFIEKEDDASTDRGNNMGISSQYACDGEAEVIIVSDMVHEGSHLVSPGKKTPAQDLPSLVWKKIDCRRARWVSELEACTLQKEYLKQSRVSGWNIENEYCRALWDLEILVDEYKSDAEATFLQVLAHNINPLVTPSTFSTALEWSLAGTVDGFAELAAEVKQCVSLYCNN